MWAGLLIYVCEAACSAGQSWEWEREWGMPWARAGSPIPLAFQLEFWSVQPGLADFIIEYVFVKVKKNTTFYLTIICRLDLHMSNIYTYGRGTSICTLALSSAYIRGRPKSKSFIASKTKCIHLLSPLSQIMTLLISEPPNEFIRKKGKK